MAKLIPLDEAAQILGVSPEALTAMRERQEIYGYRDGASWKFKPEDIERLKTELAAKAGDVDSGEDLVLLSEFELGQSGPGTSSTIIGKSGQARSPEDSDIKIAGEPKGAAPNPPGESRTGGSSVKLGGSDVKLAGSDVKKPGSDAKKKLPGSDIKPGSGLKKPGSDVKKAEAKKAEESSLPIDLGSDRARDEGSGIDLPSDIGLSSEELTIDMGSGKAKSKPSASDENLTLATPPSGFGATDSSLPLQDDSSSEELVLAGSGVGSDITISPGDSGISLVDPADSGLSLEEPLELSSSDDSSFDLGSDSSEIIGTAADFDSDAVMELKADDDFLLTPLEESVDEESEDSGSQVIALDEDRDFDDASPTVLGGQGGGTGLLEADDALASNMLQEDLGLGGPTVQAGQGMMMPSVARETPYSALVVVSMGLCVVMLFLGGMMMCDLMRNMWSWDQPYAVNSKIMDTVLSMFP